MSWIFDWFSSVLNYLGLTKKSGKLVFLGLDNAGRRRFYTCSKMIELLNMFRRCIPHPKSFRWVEFDSRRSIWEVTFRLVVCGNAADSERINESCEELISLLQDEQVATAPVLILGNKIDKPNALSEEHLKHYLGIGQLCTGKGQVARADLATRPLEVFMCSVLRRQGYGEGFRWLSQYLD
uniref:small monomeric GTPase n=1 Tax=Ditylenchus dipsaci TaxID=166011 RepID=A0A915D471_9BILA